MNFFRSGYPSLSFRRYNALIPANVRGFVLSEQVPQGKYWWIPYLSLFTDGALMQFDVNIIVPESFPPSVPAVGAYTTPQNTVKIAPTDGANNSGSMNTLSSQASRAACPLYTMNRIMIPSNSGIMIAEVATAIPAVARTIGFSFFVAVLDNGCSPPIF